MPTNVIMPALELAQETGKVLHWLKSPGDKVRKGEPLVEIETDKATTEIEAPASGVLGDVTARDGDVVPVGQTIALIFASEEAGSVAPGPRSAGAAAVPAPAAGRRRGSPLRRRRRGDWPPSVVWTSRRFAARARAAPSSWRTSSPRRRARLGRRRLASAPSGASWPSA